jgi:hypothetical protein
MEGTVEAVIYHEGGAYVRVNGMDIPMADISTIAAKGQLTQD